MCPVCKARINGMLTNKITSKGRALCPVHKAINEILELPRASDILNNVKQVNISMLSLDFFDSVSFDWTCSMRDLSRWLKAFGVVNVPQSMYARCKELAWRICQDHVREVFIHASKISS